MLAGNARDTERVWRDIAQNGNGRFIPIPQDGGQVVVIETPYRRGHHHPAARDQRHRDPLRAARRCRSAPRTRPGNCRRWRPPRPRRPPRWRAIINKRAKASSEAVTGDGDLVSDVSAGRSSFSAIKDDDLPDNLRAMKPEQRVDEVNKQMNQRKALNEKLGALVAKRDKYVADQRAKAPPKASSFDRVVEDTLKAQIKR